MIKYSNYIFIIIFSVLVFLPVFGQESEYPPMEIFIAPLAEVNGYAHEGIGIGFGFAAGVGGRLAMGIKPLFSFSFDNDRLYTMELNIFMRYFIFNTQPNTGLFVQIEGGAAVFFAGNETSIPTEFSSVSVNVCAGWRFPLKNGWYAEPFARFGYPVLLGAGAYFGYIF